MTWQDFKQRISESAIDFALNAFWVVVWGVILTAIAAVYLLFKGASPYLLVGLASAALALIFVLMITASVVFLQRRARKATEPARVGRKGFLDYRMQGQRALASMNRSQEAINRQMNRIGRQTIADARRVQRAQRGFGNTDERAYRALRRAASHLRKRATAMKLHATKYAADVSLFTEGFGKWMEWAVTKGNTDRNQFAQLADALQSFQETMDANIPHLEALRATMDGARESSEEMDVAGASLDEAVATIIESTKAASAFCAAQLPQLRN